MVEKEVLNFIHKILKKNYSFLYFNLLTDSRAFFNYKYIYMANTSIYNALHYYLSFKF